jgi:ATP-dependent helicase/nuclease subunit A
MTIATEISEFLADEQAQVLGARTDSIISAGAGAGKTTTLVASVAYDLLVDQLAAEDILVCTFTRAAAGNLLARTTAQLATWAGAAAPDISGMWIGTIDALCARLLREQALSAGLSPGFVVADERALWPLRARALQAALDHADPGNLAQLGTLFDLDSPDFADEIKRAHERLRDLDIDLDRLIIAPAHDIAQRQQQLVAKLRELADHDKITERAARQIFTTAQQLADGDYSYQLSWGNLAQVISEQAQLLKDELETLRPQLVDHDSYRRRVILHDLLLDYSQRFQTAKTDADLLDFSDITRQAERLLSAQQLPFSGFQKIYLDEAQDTNATQLAILRRLLAPGGALIAVGDANQSIYSFRQADVAAFRRQAQAADQRYPLIINRRSEAPVLAVLNQLFQRLPALAPDLITMQAAKPGHQLTPPVTWLTLVKQTHAPNISVEAQTVVPQLEKCLARANAGRASEQPVRPPLSYRDIAILVRTNAEGEAYAQALRAYNIPTLLIQKRGLLAQEESHDLLAYLQLLADPDDESALVRILSSPFVGLSPIDIYQLCHERQTHVERLSRVRGQRILSDDQDYPSLLQFALGYPGFAQPYRALQAERSRLTLIGLVRRVISLHGYDLALEIADPTGSRLRNIEKLIDIIAQLVATRGTTLMTIVEQLNGEYAAGIDEGQASGVPDTPAVTVMTIHEAKGAEFPIVVLAHLGGRENNPPKTRLRITTSGQLGLRLHSGTANYDDSAYHEERQRQSTIDADEAQRLFYVAATRAEEQLLLVSPVAATKQGLRWTKAAGWLLPQLITDDQLPAPGAPALLCPLGDQAQLTIDNLTLIEQPPTPPDLSLTETADLILDPLPAPRSLPVLVGPLSYTALSRWRRCSLRRQLEAELGLITVNAADEENQHWQPVASADNSQTLSGGLAFGIAAHQLLAQLDWHKDWPRHDSDELQLQALLDRLDQQPLRQQLRAMTNIGCEVPFWFRLDQQLLTGVIDLIADIDPEGQDKLLIDWKTGSDDEEIFAADYGLQRLLYGVALLHSSDHPETVTLITHHLGNNQQETLTLTQAELAPAREQLRQAIESIMTAPPASAAPDGQAQPFCRGCPGQERLCPVAQAS